MVKNLFKKLALLSLALLIVVQMIPTTVFAADEAVAEIVYGGQVVKTFYAGEQDQAWGYMIDKCSSENKKYNGEYTVKLLKDWSANSKGSFTGGKASGFENNTFYVPKGIYAIFDLNGHTIDRRISTGDIGYQADGEVFFVDEYATLVLKNGTVRGGGSTNGGGGIHMKSASTVILDNTILKDNLAATSLLHTDDGYGGGVMMKSSFYSAEDVMLLKLINGSKICNNVAEDEGGGVYVMGTHSTIYMDATSSICDNSADNNGGGVYVQKKSASIIGGSILNNTAGYHGGGVYLNADASISDCTISNNHADIFGGGVYVDSMYDIGLSGVMTILNNTAGEGSTHNLCLQTASATSAMITGLPATGSKIGLARLSLQPSLITKNNEITASVSSFDEKMFIADRAGEYVYWDWDPLTGSGSRKIKITENIDDIPYRPESETVSVPITESTTIKTNGYNGYDLIKGIFSYASVADKTTDYDARFYYSDGYFVNAPDAYNEHLSTMSLCLAMSAFATNAGGDTDYTDKSAHVSQLLKDIGCVNNSIYISDTFKEKPGTDTIGVAIGSKTITINGESYTLVPIAVRGAGYESEWASNVTVGKSGEHQGFAEAADEVVRQAEKYIKDHNLTDQLTNGKIKFWVVGYSRAGATANLTSKRLTDKYGNNNQVYGYDFEAPQGGVQTTNQPAYENIHNIINKADLVPMVAPTQMGFKRYGVDHYVPGDPTNNVQSVTDYAQSGALTTYYDNTAYKTKIDYSNEAPDTYIAQRSKMLIQLAAINPDVIFDDYFRVATLSYIPSVSFSERTVNTIGVAVWEEEFFTDFQRWVLDESNYGSSQVTYRNCYANQYIDGVTYQEALRVAVGIVFNRSAAESTQLFDMISRNASRIGTLMGDGTELSMIDIYNDVIGDWDELTASEKQFYRNAIYKALFTSSGTGEKISDYLTNEECSQLEKVWPTLFTLIVRLLNDDYNLNDQDHLGTLAYNSNSVMQAHYPEVNLAWLRTYDSFYNEETKNYALSTAGYTVESPTATMKNARTGGTPVTLSKNFIGEHIVYLDTESLTDEKIFYTLASEASDSSTWTYSRDQLYDANKGIYLGLQDGKSVSYKITAYAVSRGVKSQEITIDPQQFFDEQLSNKVFYILNDMHTVTVNTLDASGNQVSNVYTYRYGDTVTVRITDEPENKRFSRWWDIALDDPKSRVVTFTMGAEDKTLTAEYYDLIKGVDLYFGSSGVKASEKLVSNTPLTITNPSSPYFASLPITWECDGEVVTGSKAQYGKTYTAKVLLEPFHDDQYDIVFASTGFSATMSTGHSDDGIGLTYTPINSLYYPDSGNYLVTATLTTENDKLQAAPTDPEDITVYKGVALENLPLPQNIEITTLNGKTTVPVVWTSNTYNASTEGTYAFTGTLQLGEHLEKGNFSNTVACNVTVQAKAVATIPTANLAPNTYVGAKTVSLTQADGDHIKYILTTNGIAGTETDYTGEISLPAASSSNVSYVLSAWAVPEDTLSMDSSPKVTFNYTIKPTPCVVTILCSDTGLAVGQTAWSQTVIQTYSRSGEGISITVPQIEDEIFDHWENVNGGTLITAANKKDNIIKVLNPGEAINLKAIYIPVVNEISLNITKPVSQQKLAAKVAECSITVTNQYDIKNYLNDISWTPSSKVDGKAGYNTIYTAKVTLGEVITNALNYRMSDNYTMTVNDGALQGNVITDADGKISAVYVTFDPTTMPKLLSISPTAQVYAAHGTTWDNIKLPETMKISVEDNSVAEAKVSWTMPAGFSTTTLESQSYEVVGTVTLPSGIGNTDNLSLEVTAPLFVADAPQVDMPDAILSKPNADLDTKQVRLFCDTEGAVIHYTIDGTVPTAESPIYSSAITVSDSMVLQAIAIKDGMRNSSAYVLEMYKVTFEPNGGTVNKTTQIVARNDHVLSPLNAAKGSDVLEGWYSNAALSTPWDFNDDVILGNITLYAKWLNVSPVLSEGAVNRTSNTTATVKFTSNEAGQYYYAVVNRDATAPTISTDGIGTSCTATMQTINLTDSELSSGAKDIYIVVKDEAGNVSDPLKIGIPAYILYTVKFDANGGKGTMQNVSTLAETPYTLPVCTFTPPTGKQFKEWAIDANDGTIVAAGNTYVFTENTTVYAVWENAALVNATVTPTATSYDKYTPSDLEFTLMPAGHSFTAIQNGTTVLRPGIDYTVSGNLYTIKQSYLNTSTIGTLTLTFIMSEGSNPTSIIVISDSTPGKATVTPTIVTYDKYTPKDVNFTLNFGSYTLLAITNGETTLTAGTDYTIRGNICTIKQSYLDALAVGNVTLTLAMSGGDNQAAIIVIKDSTPPKYTITKGSEWKKGSSSGLTFTCNGEFPKYNGTQVDGMTIDASNLIVKEGSTILTLKSSYLETLPVGKHTLRMTYTDGYGETTFTVVDNNKPSTGNNSQPWVWIGIVFMSSLTAYILNKRKKSPKIVK